MKKSPANPKLSPPAQEEVRLTRSMIDHWQKLIFENGRFPRGTKKTQLSPFQLTKILAKQDRQAIIDIWQTFTKERKEIKKGLLSNKQMLVSYLLGFHLSNCARTQLILERSLKRSPLRKIWHDKKVQVIDIGCGSGALSQAFAHAFFRVKQQPQAAQFLLNDHSKLLAGAAAELVDLTSEGKAQVKPIVCPIEKLRLRPAQDFDLQIFLLGYVWNELSVNERARKNIAELWRNQLKKQSNQIIFTLDPANQDLSREMMQLRDELIQLGYQAIYPCPHQMPCPMLERSRDWCFSEGFWKRPNEQIMLDNLLKRDHSKLNATAMVFVSPNLATLLEPKKSPKSVIVGRPLNKKTNKIQKLICTPEGRLEKVANSSHYDNRGKLDDR